jgi:hypothetical protein
MLMADQWKAIFRFVEKTKPSDDEKYTQQDVRADLSSDERCQAGDEAFV